MSRTLLATLVICAFLSGGATCMQPIIQGSPPAQTPSNVQVWAVLQSGGSWTQVAPDANGNYEILMSGLRSGGVRLAFNAPYPSALGVKIGSTDLMKLEDLPKVDSNGNPIDPSSIGYYQIANIAVSQDPNNPLASWTINVVPPPVSRCSAQYSISVVDRSINPNYTGTQKESPPAVVTAVQNAILSVIVAGNGQGIVNSSPGGIDCGYGNRTQCSKDFGRPTNVTLRATAIPGSKFLGWSSACSGACTGASDLCTISTPGKVAAVFVPTAASSEPPPPNCSTPVPQPGYTYWSPPGCATNDIADHPGAYLQCDGQGYYCCEDSTGANTKCGRDKWLFPPDCMMCGPRCMLIQPYGCYMSN